MEYIEQGGEQDREDQRRRIAVWCGALGAYNAGFLHGDWLRADVEPDELWEGVNRILATSPEPREEEFGWFDHEGFQGIRIGEYEPVERVTTLANYVAEHGEPFAHWFNNDTSVELEGAGETFQESFIGMFQTERDLEEHLYEEFDIESAMQEAYGVIPGWMMTYVEFNSEGYIRDLQMNGDMYTTKTEDGWLVAFWNR